MNTPTLHGVPLLSAREFAEQRATLADHVVLVISTDMRMQKHPEYFSVAKASALIVACDATDCHLVPAIRLPQIQRIMQGVCTERHHLTLDPESVSIALVHLRLP